MPLRVLHLAGSAVSDFYADLSRLYAADCLAATADPARYEPVVAWISPDGSWRFPADLSPGAVEAAPPLALEDAVRQITALGVDVAVPQMFCVPGMTTYRSLLDLLGIPFVGNPADVMALGAHKARAKGVVAAAGVRVPEGQLLRRGDHATLALPVVVKPVDADNSLGIALVRNAEDLDAAVEDAFRHSDEVLVETYVELGREVRVGVLERDGELLCLPLEEYAVSPAKPVRLADDKLRGSGAGLGLVAKDAAHAWTVDLTDPATEPVWDLARSAHRALGCRDYSLIDVRLDPAGTPWFLEASLYCSYAQQSVLVTMARAAGIALPDLFALGVGQALARG